MNKAELISQSPENTFYKFVASMALLKMYAWIPQGKEPYHAEKAVEVGLANNLSPDKTNAELIDRRDFRAGSFRVKRGDLSPDVASSAFMYNYPEWNEFEKLTTEGEIILV